MTGDSGVEVGAIGGIGSSFVLPQLTRNTANSRIAVAPGKAVCQNRLSPPSEPVLAASSLVYLIPLNYSGRKDRGKSSYGAISVLRANPKLWADVGAIGRHRYSTDLTHFFVPAKCRRALGTLPAGRLFLEPNILALISEHPQIPNDRKMVLTSIGLEGYQSFTRERSTFSAMEQVTPLNAGADLAVPAARMHIELL